MPQENNRKMDPEEKRLIIRNVVVFFLVTAFFIAVIFFYYNRLYRATRENIIKNGKLVAEDSARRIESYLNTNVDVVNLAAYSLDEMIETGRSDAEIQNFLVSLSTSVQSAVNKYSTGLYGYINGKFFSGTNWVPPEGYDATTRPWYEKPMTTPGEITLLDPYHDIQSGNMMLALGKTLCDGVSVISIDVSLDAIQKLTEEAVADGTSDIEMMVNDAGIVAAHSDIGEVGKNYLDDGESLGAVMMQRIATSDDDHIEIDHDGSQYIVYVAKMRGGWYCVSAKDATDVFGSLRSMFLMTVLAVIATIFIIAVIISRSGRYMHMSVKAKAESKAKTAFLSKMSHELRTPINTILGMNEMILRETKEDGTKGYAGHIKKAGGDLLGLVDDILDYSRSAHGHSNQATAGDGSEAAVRAEDRKILLAPDAKVLVTDDTLMNLEVFKNLVKHTQIRVDTAESGRECIEMLSRGTYDMLFLDHMMPEKDGIETLAEIRERDLISADTPVICLTANAISGARENYISEGFDDYMTKPLDHLVLEDILIRYLPEDKVTLKDARELPEESERDLPEELISLAGTGAVDIQAGIANSGSPDGYLSLLKIYYGSIDEKVRELEESLAEGNLGLFTIKIHALKSSSRIIGAMELGDMAQALEDAGKAGEEEKVKADSPAFIEKFREYKEILSFLKPDDTVEKMDADQGFMEKIYDEILTAAQEMDCGMLDDIFEKMEGYRVPKDQEALFGVLRQASERYEYDNIVSILSDRK